MGKKKSKKSVPSRPLEKQTDPDQQGQSEKKEQAASGSGLQEDKTHQELLTEQLVQTASQQTQEKQLGQQSQSKQHSQKYQQATQPGHVQPSVEEKLPVSARVHEERQASQTCQQKGETQTPKQERGRIGGPKQVQHLSAARATQNVDSGKQQEQGKVPSPTLVGAELSRQPHGQKCVQPQPPVGKQQQMVGQPGPSQPLSKGQQQLATSTSEITQAKQPNENVPSKLDSVVTSVQGLSLRIPTRKNLKIGGTMGRKTIVGTNHLALNLTGSRSEFIVHYDVKIDPDTPKRLLRLVMEQFRKENYLLRYPAFDGKRNLYSSGYLPFHTSVSGFVTVNDEESLNPKEFSVAINVANLVSLNDVYDYMSGGTSLVMPSKVIQAIDVILREASATSRSLVQVGRSFFTPPSGRVVDLGEGLEMWYGFYQSAVLGWRPFVNIDVAHKGFPKQQNVVDLICELFGYHRKDLQALKPYQRDDLNKYLKTLKVDYEIPNQPNTKRCYRVNSVTETSARNLTFVLDDGQTTSVSDYFSREKRWKLNFPDLPCLHVGSLKRPKPIHLPVELCTVRHQVVIRKMTDTQTTNMIKKAATSADERKRKIMDAVSKAGFNSSKTVQEFGFSVGDHFEEVEARILKPPSLEYDNQVIENPRNGAWYAKNFLIGAKLINWVVLNMNGRRTDDDKLWSFGSSMKTTGERLGMVIEPPKPPVSIDCNSRDVHRRLGEYLRSVRGMQLVVVVVPDGKGNTYADVKQIAELQVGVLTQCIRARTMNKMNMSVVSNILLKVNAKLNGVNHKLSSGSVPPCLSSPCMIVGADVTHPPPDQRDAPSIAAVCASHDPRAFRYNIQFSLQEPKEEIIKDLQDIIVKQLRFFYKKTNCQPRKIIFYRDGVSEGRFEHVLREEMQAIRRACQSLSQNYQPKITFIVVQKRHHTRFFPLQRQDADVKNGNVPPGTVVDTVITHPTELDFYMVSHASIQGTSRPTKYHLLHDDDDTSQDELEQLTYYLCHMFSRCTRSVSYPTPTYYADRAAYRVKAYIEGHQIQINNLLEEQRRRIIREEISDGFPMFFV
ncbi:protein argonaute-2-like isoform X2 [Bacillus rossius redtenbacheri]